MNWEFISEINAHLTETELRYYGDIFLYCCDNYDPGNVPVVKAYELFRSANLSRDATMKILDICVGSKTNVHMSRKQFYAALKLVAAHQAGLDIHRDMTMNSLDGATPLPRFSWLTSGDVENSRSKETVKKNSSSQYDLLDNKVENRTKESPRKSGGNDSPTTVKGAFAYREPGNTTESESDAEYPRETGRNTDSPTSAKIGGFRYGLPESMTESESEAEYQRETGGSTDSPTPTNSVTQERISGMIGGETILDGASGSWQGLLVSEEQRQLLGTEEESSERHSSDEGDGDGDGSSFPPEEVWIISNEQRDYYAAQFARLQPDPEGLLAGHVARTFFEKSRLPVAELRRIWQLADVTRDGALSLQEFYVAMHLVVLRRNHVPLPDNLPPSLAFTLTIPPSKSVINQSPPQPPPPPPSPPNQTINQNQNSPNSRKTQEKTKEWTKFVDSPTGTSNLTSPGPKPVNFDFQKSAVERDPKILHPVPLRLTPEAAILASSANCNNGTVAGLVDEEVQHSTVALGQRSLNKKSLQPNDEGLVVTPKKEPPPPPPPRPYRTHTRSSSLDLNKLGKNGQNFLGAPPTIPPRVSPGISSPRKLIGQRSECEEYKATTSDNQGFVADFSQFSPKGDEKSIETGPTNHNQQFTGVCGAFHIYRKPSPKRGEGEEENKEDDESKRLTLQELREKNAELRLVCEELTRELAGALQERINLRAKLLLIT
ncbi:ralBP1-associated Eps domain-containing protein 1 isoform X2 [Chelonus insularis]|uniref:ralBP1-associated Eps domain-containing protein 1 isoform X2 n=1 Tax=Chelonus insularis TaxID=460826 RepID=UPI001588F1E5|nr:ralBP1-associated Eps domain-containing protein 1 isoform X2 [Chelonus insularis]